MKLSFSKWLKASCAVCAVALLAVSSAVLLRPMLDPADSRAVFSMQHSESTSYASFSPKVIDGQTGLPVEDAVIVIPETNERYRTDADGMTGTIRVPYSAESDFDDLHPKTWCEITLLAYANGYAPYALFYLQLAENASREGPTVMLFPGDQRPFSIIESPPDKWVSELIEKYRP